MEIWGWFVQNLFTILSSVGIIAGLWFTAFSLRAETKTRRVANLLTVTANHREIWTEFIRNEKLARVADAGAEPMKQPITDVEMVFVNMVIQHINTVYYIMNDQLVIHFEGLRRDIAEFLALPIPKSVWEKSKQFQNADFVAFVESCRNEK
jgi:hypothetical protein